MSAAFSLNTPLRPCIEAMASSCISMESNNAPSVSDRSYRTSSSHCAPLVGSWSTTRPTGILADVADRLVEELEGERDVVGVDPVDLGDRRDVGRAVQRAGGERRGD